MAEAHHYWRFGDFHWDVSPTLNGIGEDHLQLESPANERAPVKRHCLEPLIGGYAAAEMASKAKAAPMSLP